MNSTQAWSILKIAPTTSKREIRKAYAAQAEMCHPEEQPEQFALLQEAYQIALKFQKQEVVWEIESENEADKEEIEDKLEALEEPKDESQGHLMAVWQESWKEEQNRRQNTGVMQELRLIFENPKAAKGNKGWAEFCKSDMFLEKYFDEEFAETLDYYLENQTIYELSELPQGFLVEMAIAYGMIPEMDGCLYQSAGIPMRKVISKYWNQQPEMWRLQRGMRILMREENKPRIRAFSDYIHLRTLEKQELLLEEKEEAWFSSVSYGAAFYLYELNKTINKYTRSTTILRLFAYWISKENMPYFLVRRIYEHYQLAGIETSYYYVAYKELKEVILNKYPDIEADDAQDAIKKWMFRLIEIESAFMARAAVNFEPETLEETEEIHQLFASEAWEEYWDHPFMMQRLLKKTYFNNIPLTIAQYLHDAYSSKDGIVTKDCRELVEKSMAAILIYQKAVGETPVEFWEYLFMRGFGICTREVVPDEIGGNNLNDDWQKYIYDNEIYLPAYMKAKYRVQDVWQKKFVGYDVETGRIENPKFYEFVLPDGDVIKAEYHLHFIAYYRNGEPVHKPYLSYEKFEAYEKDLTVPEEFFFLLALSCITTDNRKAAKALALKWLSKTPLIDTTFPVIADCITQNNAKDRDTDECAFWENEDICLLLKKGEQGYLLYEHTNWGLRPKDLRAGIDWQQYDMKAVLEAHRKPIPRKIAAFEVEGLSNDEKAQKVLEGLMLYAKHEKGGGLNCPVMPEEFPELTSLFENGMGWLTDSFVVLHRELSPNNIRKEVFYVSIGKWGCYSSYLRDEDVEKEMRKLNDLRDKVKRSKYVECILEGRIIRDNSADRMFSWTEPFVIGKNGKLYGRYSMARLCETESCLELISKMIDFENVVCCEVFEGKMTVAKESYWLEYCFAQEEYKEAKTLHDRDCVRIPSVVQSVVEEMIAQVGEEYRENILRNMTKDYLEEWKEERYKDRSETLVEYYCNL